MSWTLRSSKVVEEGLVSHSNIEQDAGICAAQYGVMDKRELWNHFTQTIILLPVRGMGAG